MAWPASPADLRCEHLVQPLGLDESRPRLSWKLRDPRPGARQTAYQIQAASSPEALADRPDLWDSGRVESDRQLDLPWGARRPLVSRQRVCWRVRTWDAAGEPSPWSETAVFEMGLLRPEDWSARWIGRPQEADAAERPCPHLRRAFELPGRPRQARLRLAAQGLAEVSLNGRKVGNDCLTPGWTDYRQRLEVLTYDVTDLLAAGPNALGAILGDGWFAGHLTWERRRHFYGHQLALLAQLEVELEDGTRLTVVTDDSWRTAEGPLLGSDLYHGETYDARRALPGWDRSGFDEAAWAPAAVFPAPGAALRAKLSLPVRRQAELAPIARTEPLAGVHVFDFGQNLVGWVRLRVRGQPGQTVTLRFAEMLQADGTLYTANLRTARCTDRYTCAGAGEETWEPRFTFHGFRYAEITGLSEAPPDQALTAVVAHSEMPATGHFACSDPRLNQLQRCIVWGQRGNFLEAPTDCPQRDERLGWTGDAQVFARTACFNRDVAAFFTKWLVDLAEAQAPDGSVPHVVPDVLTGLFREKGWEAGGAAAWADAAILIPWTVYLCYGDTRILERQYDSMVRWLRWQETHSRDLINPHAAFGDWLSPDAPAHNCGLAPTPKDLLATAFFAHGADLLARIAGILGRKRDARAFAALFRRIRAAFQREFVTPNGRLVGQTQTGYLLALAFDLLPEEGRPPALAQLEAEIDRHQGHLATGFVGTPLLCPVLSRFGRTDLAYRVLMRETWPGWLYTMAQGATTMWERWNSYSRQQGFGDAGMNSFNHYAYGSIGEWLYATVAGLDLDESGPGYRHLRFRPQPGGGLTSAEAALETRYGRAAIRWEIVGDTLRVDLTAPPNTQGTVELPGCAPLPVEPGPHSFTIPWPPAPIPGLP